MNSRTLFKYLSTIKNPNLITLPAIIYEDYPHNYLTTRAKLLSKLYKLQPKILIINQWKDVNEPLQSRDLNYLQSLLQPSLKHIHFDLSQVVNLQLIKQLYQSVVSMLIKRIEDETMNAPCITFYTTAKTNIDFDDQYSSGLKRLRNKSNIKPLDAIFYYGAIASYYLSQESYHQALQHFTYACEASPNNYYIRSRKAFCLEKLGFYLQAIQEITYLIRHDSCDATILSQNYSKRAALLFKQGLIELAKKDLNTINRLFQPKSIEPHQARLNPNCL